MGLRRYVMREEMGAIGRDLVINGFSYIQRKTKQTKSLDLDC